MHASEFATKLRINTTMYHVSSESYMPDVDLRLILIVNLVENQLVFIKKARASWIRRISKMRE